MRKATKSKLLLCAVAIAVSVVTLLGQNTLAFYSVSSFATNVVTSGDIQLSIIEKMGDQDFPAGGVYIMPGSVVGKKVMVENIGNHPFWLRVKLTNGIDDETLSPDMFELDVNTEDWLAAEDGFYYFKRPVVPGETTPRLFSQVRITGEMDNSYLGKTLQLTVTAHAVQSEHNDAATPTDVVGWPSESQVAE